MDMSGAAKFKAAGIFSWSKSAPSQGQSVRAPGTPASGSSRAVERQRPTCCCGGLGGGGSGPAAPTWISCGKCCSLWAAPGRCGIPSRPFDHPPRRPGEGAVHLGPGLTRGWPRRPVFLSGNSSWADSRLAKPKALSLSLWSAFLRAHYTPVHLSVPCPSGCLSCDPVPH